MGRILIWIHRSWLRMQDLQRLLLLAVLECVIAKYVQHNVPKELECLNLRACLPSERVCDECQTANQSGTMTQTCFLG